MKFKEDLDFKAKPKAFFFSMIDDYEAGKDMQLDDYLNNFKIVKLVEEGLHFFLYRSQQIFRIPTEAKEGKRKLIDWRKNQAQSRSHK